MKILLVFFLALTALLPVAKADTIIANFTSADTIPVTASSYLGTGNDVSLSLGFAPPIGTNLMVVKNTGLAFIQGVFSNLSQGQKVSLTHAGISYNFVANYYGGTGNDLVLQWANSKFYAWGANNAGQLGNISPTDSSVPVAVTTSGILSGKTIVSIAAGDAHSLALCSDGTLAAWGDNSFGQLGDNSTATSLDPVSITSFGILSGKRVIAIAAGESHSLALCADGTVAAWGLNNAGQLGNNSTTDSSVPVAVTTSGILSGKTIVSIAAGCWHSLALCSNGTVVAWGDNYYGQLGNNSTIGSGVPVAVSATGFLSDKTAVVIAAGGWHSIVLCADGTLASWGINGNGQLGNNSTANSHIPINITSSGILADKSLVSIAAGGSHNLALCSDGTMAAWGYNAYGQLGNGSIADNKVPVSVTSSGILSDKTVVGISTGSYHSLALCSNGTVVAWGGGFNGQLGNNSTSNSDVPVLVNSSYLAASERFVAIGLGPTSCHNFAIVATPPWPEVATMLPTSISLTGATLNGIVNANANSATVSFEYGPTLAYGTTVDGTPSTLTGVESTAVSASISGLTPTTQYHYRVVSTNALGASSGADMYFVTTSMNANLAGLVLGTGALSPSFNSATTEYTASVSNATTSITVKPTAADNLASVKVNGVAVISGSFSGAVNLAVGLNVISIKITAQDGITTKTYTVTITRLSTNADLASLWTSAGTLSPFFNSATIAYTASVSNATTSITVMPSVADATASVKVNGVAVISGSFSGAVNLSVGLNAISIKVTAQDGITTKTYTVTIQRLDVDSVYSDGSVMAWGAGTTNTGTNPEYGQSMVPDGLVGVTKAVAAGRAHTLALKNDGTLVAWGNNTYGQTTLSPTAFATGGSYSSLITLTAPNAAIVPGMSVTGTGIGSGAVVLSKDVAATGLTLSAYNTAAVVNTSTLTFAISGVKAIAAGSDHSLALKNDGTVLAWGRNTEAQITLPTSLGLGTYSGVLVTVPASGVNPANNVVTLSGSAFNANIVPGMLVTAGNGAGTNAIVVSKSGNNLTLSVSNTNVAQLSSIPWTFSSGVVAIAAGDYHSMALKQDGTVVAWGDNTQGQTSIVTSYPFIATLFPVNTGGTVKTATLVAANANIVANMLVTGPAITVGAGAVLLSKNIDNLGLNFDRNNANIAAIVAPGAMLTFWSVPKVKTFVSGVPPIAAGGYHSVLLRTDGTVSVWGKIWNGVAWVTETIPAGLTNVTAIAAGRDFTLALLNTGAVVAWGDNSHGQTTVPAAALSGVTAIAANGDHAVALKSDGTVVAWGKIADGLGGFIDETRPAAALGGVTAIAAGANHTAAIGTFAPVIISNPTSVSANQGTTTTFSVAVSGVSPWTYQWRKNAMNLADGGSVSGSTSATLTLTNVQLVDAGSYSVVVTSATSSSINSATATLTFIASPLAAAVNGPGSVWTTGGDAPWFAQSATTHDRLNAARSGAITDNQTSSLQTTLTGPGTLSFWWMVSSEDAWDFLEFYLDGVLQNDPISGETDWQQRTFTIPVGSHTVEWRYVKDDAFSSGQDAGWLDSVTFVVTSPAPAIDTQPVSRINVAGTTATFTVTATGTAPLTYQWRKNAMNLADGGNVSGSTSATLTLTNVQLADAGSYSVIVTNAYDSVTSTAAILTFTPPAVTTTAASEITANTATLNGTVNPNGLACTARFEYGLTDAYGSKMRVTLSPDNGLSVQNVSAILSGLQAGTPYHYRLTGTSDAGTNPGEDRIFTTAGVSANLAGLTMSGGALSPAFSSSITSYTGSVSNLTTSITITPTVVSPTSTVKVNGVNVASGTASQSISLAPGPNTITVLVTALDGVTTKTYTLSVTGFIPTAEIQVEHVGTDILTGSAQNFGYSSAGRSSSLTFKIKNIGNTDLTGLGITIDGPDSAMFTVTSPPVPPVSGPAGSTEFTVRFLASSGGVKTGVLHLGSNDNDESTFDINFTGRGLSLTTDTDEDGLNDAAEFQMEALGFNWQLSQPELVATYFANAAAGGLGPTQGLLVDTPILTRNSATGLFKLQIGIHKSTDLLNFVPFPMTAPKTSITGDGKLEFEFASPDNAAFYRLLAE